MSDWRSGAIMSTNLVAVRPQPETGGECRSVGASPDGDPSGLTCETRLQAATAMSAVPSVNLATRNVE